MYKKIVRVAISVLDRRVSFCIYSEQSLRGKEKKREREDRFSLAMMMRNTNERIPESEINVND